MWCNYVCMADHGFVLLELGALMASLKCVNSEDRTSKYLSNNISNNWFEYYCRAKMLPK